MFQKVFLKLTRARRFRSGMIALCAIGVIVFLATGVSPLLALGTVTMRVAPATRAAPVNGTFTVDIVADVGTEMNPNGLGAYEFDLVYDPNYLEVDSATDAGGLSSTNRTVAELGPNIDNPGGRTTFAAYSYPPEDVSGPGDTVVLATVTLKAKRAGVTTLNLENALMADTQANAWPDGVERTLDLAAGRRWILDALFSSADYDGDGWTDMAEWSPSLKGWTILTASSGFTNKIFKRIGHDDGIPVPGDYDGDGWTDMAEWSPSLKGWTILTASSGFTNKIFKRIGHDDGIPVPDSG